MRRFNRELNFDPCKLSKADAAYVIRTFFDKISEALIDSDRVEIRGLFALAPIV